MQCCKRKSQTRTGSAHPQQQLRVPPFCLHTMWYPFECTLRLGIDARGTAAWQPRGVRVTWSCPHAAVDSGAIRHLLRVHDVQSRLCSNSQRQAWVLAVFNCKTLANSKWSMFRTTYMLRTAYMPAQPTCLAQISCQSIHMQLD